MNDTVHQNNQENRPRVNESVASSLALGRDTQKILHPGGGISEEFGETLQHYLQEGAVPLDQ